MKIIDVPAGAFPELYRAHLKKDFPKKELKPLAGILRAFKKGQYSCQVLVDDGELLAYACFLHGKDCDGVLLDYFAVASGRRGGGIGSIFLVELCKTCKEQGIIIECEMPSKARNEEERIIRERRIAFYERSGAQLSGYGWHSFGVDYNLLWMPVKKRMERTDLGGDIQRLYRQTMPRFVFKSRTKLYFLAEEKGEGR